jgi:hypothetical protein
MLNSGCKKATCGISQGVRILSEGTVMVTQKWFDIDMKTSALDL